MIGRRVVVWSGCNHAVEVIVGDDVVVRRVVGRGGGRGYRGGGRGGGRGGLVGVVCDPGVGDRRVELGVVEWKALHGCWWGRVVAAAVSGVAGEGTGTGTRTWGRVLIRGGGLGGRKGNWEKRIEEIDE